MKWFMPPSCYLFSFFQPSSVHGRRRPSSSLSIGCVVSLRGDWDIFCPAGSGLGWQSAISQGKILWNILPRPGTEPGPRREQIMRYIHSPTELPWPGAQGGQTVRYIHSPTELSWPWPWRGQTVRTIHSSTELSWPWPWRGQTARYLHSPTELSKWFIREIVSQKPNQRWSGEI